MEKIGVDDFGVLNVPRRPTVRSLKLMSRFSKDVQAQVKGNNTNPVFGLCLDEVFRGCIYLMTKGYPLFSVVPLLILPLRIKITP